MANDPSASLLDQLPAIVGRVRDAVGDAVVTVGRDRRGAGLVIADGRVLTNAHHLRDRTTQITFADGRTIQAELVGADADGDLAVLAVDTGTAAAVTWGDGDVAPGQVVLAAALGGHGLRVTVGTVSAVGQSFRGPRGRRIGGSVEHTAPLARGSSGGPLLDTAGAVIGINTHRLGDGFYLARPADAELRRRVDELSAGQAPTRRRLGVAVAPPAVARRLRQAVGLPERDGLLVRGVEDGSPAAAAGVQRGDLIVAADATPIETADALWSVLDALPTDRAATVELGLVRGADELTVQVLFPAPDPAGGASS
jgi:S1-C subfamily serine protease